MKLRAYKQLQPPMLILSIVFSAQIALATTLLDAVSAGNVEKTKTLIASGVSLNQKSVSSTSPLAMAFAREHKEIAQLLIDAGAAVNVEDVLQSMALNAPLPLIKKIFAKHPEIDLSKICILALDYRRHDQFELQHFLIKKGAPVNCEEGYFGKQPLHTAAAHGDIKIIKDLLDRGANINAQFYDGNLLPINFAINKGQTEVAHFLKEKGSDLNLEAKVGLGYRL